jgi:selenocysteine lyase/cysteine desulfurase
MEPAELRADVPVAEEVAYLNTGAGSPSPRRVVRAAAECIEYQQTVAPAREGTYRAVYDAFGAARGAIADFLGVAPGEIALTESTADGICRVADALPFEPGDVVVRTDCEHPAGVLPWRRLGDTAGIEVRVVETDRGRLDLDALAEAVSGADLLCLSSLTWNYGTCLPVEDAVEIAHDAGARVLVDAVQSPGQVDVDLDAWGADFTVGAGHKWLLGPWGAGFLHVREGAEAMLEPRTAGYRSVTDADAPEYELAPGARRLEIGSTSPAPHAGLAAALSVIEDVGLGTIEDHVERLTDRLKTGLIEQEGCALLSPHEYESGLVTFAVEDPEATVTRLKEAGVVIRSLPDPAAVRASVHVFNTRGDVDALLDAL